MPYSFDQDVLYASARYTSVKAGRGFCRVAKSAKGCSPGAPPQCIATLPRGASKPAYAMHRGYRCEAAGMLPLTSAAECLAALKYLTLSFGGRHLAFAQQEYSFYPKGCRVEWDTRQGIKATFNRHHTGWRPVQPRTLSRLGLCSAHS